MDICNFPVSLLVNILHKVFYALNVVGAYRRTVMMYIVDRYYRQITVHQFQDVRIIVIGTDDCDSFKVPVSAVFIIGHLAVLKTGIDKCDIVPLLLCLNFKTVEHTREIFMGKTAARLFLKEDSYIIGTVGLECSRCRIGKIPECFCCLLDPMLRLFADILLVVECLAYRCSGDTAFLSYRF